MKIYELGFGKLYRGAKVREVNKLPVLWIGMVEGDSPQGYLPIHNLRKGAEYVYEAELCQDKDGQYYLDASKREDTSNACLITPRYLFGTLGNAWIRGKLLKYTVNSNGTLDEPFEFADYHPQVLINKEDDKLGLSYYSIFIVREGDEFTLHKERKFRNEVVVNRFKVENGFVIPLDNQ